MAAADSATAIGNTVHFRDERKRCVAAIIIASTRIGIQTGETPEGKPIYEQREGIEIEVLDNGGRYRTTVLHRDRAHVRANSFHLASECEVK